MKKTCIVLFTLLLLLFSVGCKGEKTEENLYFIMPYHYVQTPNGWNTIPYEVYRYTGGDTYSLMYAFPDSGEYAACLSGAYLYYVPEAGGSITRVDLSNNTEQPFAGLPDGRISTLVAEGDKVFAIWNSQTQHVLYQVTIENAQVICSDVMMQAELALGDGGLYYVDFQEGTLIRYDLSGGENQIIADRVGSGKLEFDGGFVYSCGTSCYRYNVETGEKAFVHRGSGSRVKDDWLYYPDSLFCEGDSYVEVLRRNMKNGTIESCGSAFIPYLGAQTFRKTIDFGAKGFVVYLTERTRGTEYMYFPYGASQGRLLHSTDVIQQGE